MLLGQPIHNSSIHGIAILLLALLIVLVVSFILIRLIDQPVQTLRTTLKKR